MYMQIEAINSQWWSESTYCKQCVPLLWYPFSLHKWGGRECAGGDCPCVAIVIKMPHNPAILHSNFCFPNHTDK